MPRNVFKPRQHVQRHRHPRTGPAREENQFLEVVVFRLGLLLLRSRPFVGLGYEAGGLGEAKHIQDERHFAVAHNGCSGIGADIF